MFEYINTGLIFTSSLVCFALLFSAILASGKAIHENKKTKAPYFFLAAALFMVAMTIEDGINTKSTIEKNIALFQEGKELQCATLGTLYLVSKKTGWKLHKESFTKNSILLNARYCDE